MALCLFLARDTAEPRLGLIAGEQVIDVAAAGGPASLAEALAMPLAGLREQIERIQRSGTSSLALASVTLMAPIDRQEVWAAGVTYLRSRDARMEESREKTVYDRVYEADRPELFLKATPNRVSGPGEPVAIRGDSTWDVPEPELTLVVNRDGEIVGYTIGNDVSSRSIEGENPLYLPQAKVYARCAALGPVIALAWELPGARELPIRLIIRRGGQVVFQGETSTAQMHRTFDDLVTYVRRCNEFPHGVMLMTGTGIVPPSDFTLEDGDDVEIIIDGIGSLRNPVIRGC
ncbi:MAG: 2-hydroxyhepta-2,4-diene-1,7-dioate isomerase [Thermomicrobiales bacterium]|nr:MAG: 2-hydroxyhepta-2,4-diene-1,7-dioate isomerase [Thermomicrobiales bacterium]